MVWSDQLQQNFLGIVLKNVGQLQSMSGDLLTVTQVREGKSRIEAGMIFIEEAVIDAVNTLHGAAARNRIHLSSKLNNRPGLAFADPTRLRMGTPSLRAIILFSKDDPEPPGRSPAGTRLSYR